MDEDDARTSNTHVVQIEKACDTTLDDEKLLQHNRVL